MKIKTIRYNYEKSPNDPDYIFDIEVNVNNIFEPFEVDYINFGFDPVTFYPICCLIKN